MRSKSKARKLTQDENEEFEPSDATFLPTVALESTTSPNELRGEQPPIYIPEDIPIPEEFELKESNVYSGLGVWTKVEIQKDQKFGPFVGTVKNSVDDTTCAWEIVNEIDESRFWIDASDPGTGNWMKYIRRTDTEESQNLMAVQVQEQVYYRAVRDIGPGEEMLLYGTETVYPEKDLESFAFTKISDQDGTNYPCDCGEVFRSKVALKRHQTYACSHHHHVKTITSGMNLEQNNNGHTEDDIKEQQIASISRNLTDGENSSDAVDGGETGEFKCEECPQSFQWKSNLIRHQIAHDSCRKFCCENCDKVFTDPSNLQRHIRSQHVGARSHACGECGKTFATSSGLKQHQHIHSSVKPFQCEVCLKAYTQFSNLCRHKRMHADCRQQIKCKDCGQAFSTVTSLSKHKRFCEGALRNGMHLGFPPAEKLNPLSLSSATHAPLNPALYMGMYRPPYPFYPPIGATFPVFPGSHPFSALNSPVSPSNPAKLAQPTSPDGKATIPSHVSTKLLTESEKDRIKEDKHARRNSFASESNDSPLSSGSDLDNSSASDAESESSSVKKPRLSLRPDSSSEPRRLVFPSSQSRLTPEHISPKLPENKFPASAEEPSTNQDVPFDLSKSSRSSTPSPKPVTTNDTVKPSGEQPLDLTQKATKELTPPDNARKTHIFGMPFSTPDTKLHYAYPQFGSPFLFDQLRVDKEKFQQSFQEAAKFMPFSRFPLGSPSYAAAAMGSFGMMKAEHGEKTLSPLMKMDKIQDHFPYSSSGNKLKERYSCKFCGKVFPRSANLTRHLRTHTGEQPYKCKYCERSFSISSNLQRHVRNIHNKEKPFRCSLCDRCFGQQTNLDRHLKKHETEGPNVRDSPINEPDLDSKDESYFSEIRNFIGKATDTVMPYARVNGDVPTDSHSLMSHQVDREDKLDVADEDDEVDELELDDDMEEEELEENSSVENSPLKLSLETDDKVSLNKNRDLKPMTQLTNGFHINGDKLELISRPESDK